MKKLLIIPILLLAVYSKAQVGDYPYSQADLVQRGMPDTTKLVPFHQVELIAVFNQFQNIENRLHKLDIPALKRDTLDNLIMGMQQFMVKRFNDVTDPKKEKADDSKKK